MKAWYFSSDDRRLRHGDERTIILGETHEVSGDIELCKRGLHACKKAIDALTYAPGPVVYRVELSGKIEKGEDKLVAQKRTYLSGGIDVSETLRKFARMCALDVVDMWEAPEVVIRYLKTGDKSIRAAAQDAARSVSWSAAHVTADYTVQSAALAVARAAARDDAQFNADYAVRAAAVASVEYAVWNESLATAQAAIEYAAQDEARRKQNKRLTSMIARAIRDANFGGTND